MAETASDDDKVTLRARMTRKQLRLFAEAARAADQDMSKVIRQFIRWYIGGTDVLPVRPPRNKPQTRARSAAR